MNYNFSIIIPHKNTPQLLRKCLDSIPKREDIQIIVVDDNSDASIVNFENFPGKGNAMVEVYFTKEGRGAGYARNVGLEHAQGVWIVFADADDYFLPDFSLAIDMYKDSEFDIVYFKRDRLNFDNTITEGANNEYIDYAAQTGDYTRIKYWMSSPVSKFIKSSFLYQFMIKFEEIRWSNDVMFSNEIAVFAKSILVSNLNIYRVVSRKSSLTKQKTVESATVRLLADCRSFVFLKEHGLYEKVKPIVAYTMQYWINIFYVNKIQAIKLLPTIIHCMDFKSFCLIIYRNKKRILKSIFNYE